MASVRRRATVRNGREHARHFKRKVDAQRWLDEVTAAMVTGSYVDPAAGWPGCDYTICEPSTRRV